MTGRMNAGWGMAGENAAGKRVIGKPVAGILMCIAVAASSPSVSLAGSPEFAYTAEQWASFRDNKLEFDEIAYLIHEYNNTVIQNQIAYKEYRGETRDDISQDYYDAADDVYGAMDYPDSSDSDFASRLSSYLNSQIQVDKLREQGDDNVDDGEIKKLGYDQTEATLVKQAQTSMINYWTQAYNLENLNEGKVQAQLAYDSTVTKLNAGMGTQADVLSAKESVSSAEAAILSARTSLDKTKEELCLMLGWTYGADVEICDVPEPDIAGISAIDMEADITKALENNYSLKILEKQIGHAVSTSNRESLEQSYKNQKEVVANSVKTAYQDLILAKEDYVQAQQSYESESSTMAAADRKLLAGTMTRNDYQKQKSSFTTAEVNVRTKKLALLTAQVNYDWAVDGLASVS